MAKDRKPGDPGYGRCPVCGEVYASSKCLDGLAFCGAEDPPCGYIVDAFPEVLLYDLRNETKTPRARVACGDYPTKAFRLEGQQGLWRRVKQTFVVPCVIAWHDGTGFKEAFLDRTGVSRFIPYAPKSVIKADRDKPVSGEQIMEAD